MLRKVLVMLAAFSLAAFISLPAIGKDEPSAKVTCPVTGKEVKNLETAAKSEYKGKTYYFCCPACKEKFDKDPEKYVGGSGKASEASHGHDGGHGECTHNCGH